MSQLIIHTYSEGEPNWEYVGEPHPDVIELEWSMFNDEWGNYGPDDFAAGRELIGQIEDERVRNRILADWDAELEQWREMNEEPLPDIVVGNPEDHFQLPPPTPRRPHPTRPLPVTLHSLTP